MPDFNRPYGAILKEKNFQMMLRGQMTTAAQVHDNLLQALNNVYSDVVYKSGSIDPVAHPMEHTLFNNPFRIIDGPWYVEELAFANLLLQTLTLSFRYAAFFSLNLSYAFLVHGLGPAIGGQGLMVPSNATNTSSNVIIQDNFIEKIHCWNKEIPGK